MDDPEITVIVGELSTAQRQFVAGDRKSLIGWALSRARARGLVKYEPTSDPARAVLVLTPLGLRVREALTNPQPEKRS